MPMEAGRKDPPASGYGGWYAAEKERKEDRSKI